MATDLYSIMANWQQYGFFDIFLPFLLIFTLSFAVLEKTKILGTSPAARKINVIVALILGLLFLQNTFLIVSLQNFLPNVSYIIVVLLMFLLFVGIFAGKEHTGYSTKAATIIAIIAIIWAFFSEIGFYGGTPLDWIYGIFGPDVLPLALFVILAIIIYFFVKDTEPSTPLGK